MHTTVPSLWQRFFNRRDSDNRWRHDARRTLRNLRRQPDARFHRTRVHSASISHRVSVIIPTLNEASFLPPLLDALNAQTLAPHEIIVADAGSTDGTVAAAEARGARVVPGGMPGRGQQPSDLRAWVRALRRSLCCYQGVTQQHGNCHWPDAARHGRNRPGHRRHLIKGDIAHQPIALLFRRIGH